MDFSTTIVPVTVSKEQNKQMKNAFSLFTVFCLTLLFTACSNNEPAAPDNSEEYLVFGYFSQFCSNCDKTMFKLTRASLAYDSFQSDFNWPEYDFNQEGLLSQSDHNNAIQLLDLLPDDLKNTDKAILGCPDCTDQGGFYIEFPLNGEIRKVVVDPFDSDDQTEDIVAYKNAMQVILALIEQD